MTKKLLSLAVLSAFSLTYTAVANAAFIYNVEDTATSGVTSSDGAFGGAQITESGKFDKNVTINVTSDADDIMGGYYIGRYELGLEGDTPVSKNASTEKNKDKVITADAGSSSLKNWYGLYKKCSEYKVPEINDSSVTSTMIWGSQYDAMLNWMQDNEKNITSSNTSKQNNSYVTGQGTNDVISNVFDLYACHREWTLEAYSNYGRVSRGGSSGGSVSPSSRSSYGPTLTYSFSSSRLTLYIK